jgi:hypothetical protein
MTRIHIGAVGAGVLATVDERGTVTTHGATLAWRVRVGDDWRRPGDEIPVRVTRPGPAPIAHAAVRAHGDDVTVRVYALGDEARSVLVDVENGTGEAIAVAFELRSGSWDDVSVLRPAGATEPDGARVYPVPHRTTFRLALGSAPIDVRHAADAGAVARGWERMLDRAMRVELPEPLQSEVDAARADLLLAPPSGATFATLEAWGFDAEALTMWSHLGFRERRAARRGPVGTLGEVRDALVREEAGGLAVFPGFRSAWLGQSLAVHDVPLRTGRASFALRWHGARPALLWDVPDGLDVRAPALDPAFGSREPHGEALLAEPPTELLAMGLARPERGAPVAPPEQFS